MQLSKIKLSGFKSFVDPTTILLPSQLVAVVGPNGCGKSNIIDAVTWVMGESSPKYLRGEALADVIFNGSTTRKPVGQATVELLFNNEEGGFGGEYASFSEISVKRVINRDADAAYYLNGVRCRKRDIVDIFLGTGLGPRSYSIIGQNMISKVTEAKPDELRVYLEEAAGISKYKERRHETELRIQHTKENLARVNDLRAELEKQLSHLKHQANVAEKYKVLKEQERTLRAEICAIEWRQLDSHMVDHTLQIKREETALEARQAELSGTERDIEQMRHEQRAAHDAFQEVQRRYYAVGNEITRIEQDILHHQERQHQWENDLKQAEQDWQSVQNQMSELEDQLFEFERAIQQAEPQLITANKSVASSLAALKTVEEAMQDWQDRWDDFNREAADMSQRAQVEKTRAEHLEQKILSLKKRQEQLHQSEGRFNFSELNKELEIFTKQSTDMNGQLQSQNKKLADVQKEITQLQNTQQDSHTQLDRLRSELQRLRGKQASLEALQQTALGQRDNTILPWIKENKLENNLRLAQHIEVEKGWELAVEKVLGFSLQAICVDSLENVTPTLEKFNSGNLCVLAKTTKPSQQTKSSKGTLLLEKIKSHWPLQSLLANVYISDSFEHALALSASLDAHESVVTQDGIWLSPAWFKILKQEDAALGVFQREKELKELSTSISTMQAAQVDLEKSIVERTSSIKQLEQERNTLQQTCNQLQAQSAQVNAQQKAREERLTELQSQSEQFAREQTECANELQKTQHALITVRASFDEAMTMLNDQADIRDSLLKEKDQFRNDLQTKRESLEQSKQHAQELEMRLHTNKSKRDSIKQSITHFQSQFGSLNERKRMLQSELSSMPPLDTLKKSLSRALDKHVSIEVELNTARVAMESLDQEYRHLEEKRHVIDKDINKIRAILESLRVEWQGWKVKSDTLLEQIKETQFALEDILKELSQEAILTEWQSKLDQTLQRIQRLGAINLVAIDEYSTCFERKTYLDKQMEDLQSGLSMLEDAIAKIDQETKIRFKETFDEVNKEFQRLFPAVFGGGKAYLELTNDELLEAGVTMMACPPGKRNSSIYLLSGGEKSLTGLAFIFSIFHLNPAPFCMLDEVDAALDDANVLRFTRLVKAMTEKTQFIFISHNKMTIEMAEHLIGVTMNEPGVSRLVSVDIQKAMNLAGV